jgi:hypothetical protein
MSRILSRIFFLLLRIVCYFSLALVVAGIASLALVSAQNACPRLDTGAIQCVAPGYKALAEFGMSVVLFTVFTGLPALLAMGGLAYLVRDTLWFIRRRRDRAAAGAA